MIGGRSKERFLVERKRVALWDNLKFILIIAVVLGHFINIRDSVTYHSLFIFIYSFHMPLFVFLAGLFHKNEGVWKKALAFLGIYVLYKLSIYGIKMAFLGKAKLDLFNESAAPWFMLALVFYIVLGFALHKLMEHRILKWVVLFVMIAFSCYAGYVEDIGSFLALAKVIYFFPFYLLGIILDRKKLEKLAENRKWKIGGAAIVLVWLLICLIFLEEVYQMRPFMVAKASYPEYAQLPFIWRLQGYIIAVVVGFSLILATPVSYIKPVTLWGSRTIQVYFWHKLVLYVFQYTDLDKWFYDGGLHKTLWMIVAVIITCILSLWVFRYPTELIMGFTRSGNKKE